MAHQEKTLTMHQAARNTLNEKKRVKAFMKKRIKPKKTYVSSYHYTRHLKREQALKPTVSSPFVNDDEEIHAKHYEKSDEKEPISQPIALMLAKAALSCSHLYRFPLRPVLQHRLLAIIPNKELCITQKRLISCCTHSFELALATH